MWFDQLRGKGFPNLGEWKSVVFKSGNKASSETKDNEWAHFSLFSPTISGKYLFIFYKLEEDNICLIISSSFGWVQLSFDSNPKKEWSVPVCNRTGPLLWNFNESSIGETRRFWFLESLKKLKKTPGWTFS